MIKIPKCLKILGFILSFFFLQSCSVYYKTPISLEEAVNREGKVKIRTAEGKNIKYKKITLTDGQFYGARLQAGKWTQIPLFQSEIENIRLKNKSASTWATITAVVVPVGALILIGSTVDYGIGCIWCSGY